jgi:hypothetical protein
MLNALSIGEIEVLFTKIAQYKTTPVKRAVMVFRAALSLEWSDFMIEGKYIRDATTNLRSILLLPLQDLNVAN